MSDKSTVKEVVLIVAYFLTDLEERTIKKKVKEKKLAEDTLTAVVKQINRIQGVATNKFYEGKTGAYISIRFSFEKNERVTVFLDCVNAACREENVAVKLKHCAGEVLIKVNDSGNNYILWKILLQHVSKLERKSSEEKRKHNK